MMKYADVVLVVIAILALGFYVIIPRTAHSSTAAKLTITNTRLKTIAEAMQAYQSDFDALPNDLNVLVKSAEIPESILTSPFDAEGTVSFRYDPYGLSHESLDRKIMVYCTSDIPETVRSADGDTSPGLIPVLYDDLTIGGITKDVRTALKALPRPEEVSP